MGILNDIETTLKNGDQICHLLEEKEELIFDLLIPGVSRVVTRHNLADILKLSLEKACFPLLSKYKNREVMVLDCKGLTKKDAYGMMASLAEKVKIYPSLIVVIENIAGIWSDPYCEDPQYVVDLLAHSWKNEQIYFGDYHIDRTGMTIILTTTPENQKELEQMYRTDSYSWVDDFDTKIDTLQKAMDSLQ